MKKNILLITAVVIAATASAQSNMYYGFQAGVSSADMRGNALESLDDLVDVAGDYVSTGSRTGFFTGAYIGIPLAKGFAIEPGLNYSQKGYQLKGALNVKGIDVLGINAKAQLQLNYLELPVLLKAHIGGLQLYAGPQISYLVNSNLKVSAGALGVNFLSYKIPVTSQFNHWDAAVTGGIGYQFNNGLNLKASYDHGLSKIDAGKNVDAYNRMMKVGIGLTF